MKTYQFVILTLLFFLPVCADPLEDGLESLEGNWQVTRSVEVTSKILNGGTEELSQLSVENPEGRFEFDGQIVHYSYVTESNEIAGVDDYTLTMFNENSGYTKVTRFDLQIGERVFRTVFDDDTKKSYKDAARITLTETIQSVDIETTLILTLEKE